MNPHDEQKLERLIHQTLREIPARRAPRSLEQRVMAELERRASQPWWKQSVVRWPMGPRIAFLLLSGGVAKPAMMAVVWALAGFDTAQFQAAFATPIGWM